MHPANAYCWEHISWRGSSHRKKTSLRSARTAICSWVDAYSPIHLLSFR
jgi:hypothetical protein